jgi:glycosyltransferase involved in cell wall biosynthesis
VPAPRPGARKPRLALLVNVVAPYRVAVYRALAARFDMHLVVSGAEGNRSTWDDARRSLPELRVSRAWGLTLRWNARGRAGVFDHRYLHLNPGYLTSLLRIRPDVVVSNELGARTLCALLYGALFRAPVFVWWGGTPHTERGRGRVKRTLRRVLAGWVRHWISYGNTSSEYLAQLGVPRERIVQIQNCVDETLYRRPVAAALELPVRPVFLFVGQLIERKGVGALLRAAARQQRAGREFSLLLVGDGPERERCEQAIAELGLRNVTLLGGQPPARMPAVYRAADVLVFPTAEDVWGLVVNEALWSGRDVIASKHAGCAPELLPQDHVFDPDDDDSFDAAWRGAFERRLSPVDRSRLWPAARAGRVLVDAITGALASRRGRAVPAAGGPGARGA